MYLTLSSQIVMRRLVDCVRGMNGSLLGRDGGFIPGADVDGIDLMIS